MPSVALGSGEVTLQSLTAAYATFANGGSCRVRSSSAASRTATARCSTRRRRSSRRAFSRATAFLMASMLTDVVNAGTAYRVRADGFVLPAAGKTGTTNDYVDAWFVGFTPSLVAGVWVGFDQPQTIVAAGYAGDLAVPLWADFMKEATKGDKPVWLKPPADVIAVDICRMSGRRPGENCDEVEVVSKTGETKVRSMIMTEYFVKGTEPYDECPIHSGTGLLTRLGGLFGGGSGPCRGGGERLAAARARDTAARRHGHGRDAGRDGGRCRQGRRAEEEARVLGPHLRNRRRTRPPPIVPATSPRS